MARSSRSEGHGQGRVRGPTFPVILTVSTVCVYLDCVRITPIHFGCGKCGRCPQLILASSPERPENANLFFSRSVSSPLSFRHDPLPCTRSALYENANHALFTFFLIFPFILLLCSCNTARHNFEHCAAHQEEPGGATECQERERGGGEGALLREEGHDFLLASQGSGSSARKIGAVMIMIKRRRGGLKGDETRWQFGNVSLSHSSLSRSVKLFMDLMNLMF